MDEAGCYACQHDEGGEPWEFLYADHAWRVAHAFDSALAGWLVLLPRRHVTAAHELDASEAARLGLLVRAASEALVEVTGCEKTYVMLFAEAEGFAHLHVHVVPRHTDLPPELRGPRVFGYLGASPERRVPEVERDELVARLRPALLRAMGPAAPQRYGAS